MKQNDRYYTSSSQINTAKTNVKDIKATIIRKESRKEIYEIDSSVKSSSFMKSLIVGNIFESSSFIFIRKLPEISLPNHLSYKNSPIKTLNSIESKFPKGKRFIRIFHHDRKIKRKRG